MKYILASQSPRRQELLKNIISEFETINSNFDESLVKLKNPKQLVKKLSSGKCENVFKSTSGERCVIGADTIVYIDGEILGKPKDKDDAKRMLKILSGRTHSVLTGICIYCLKDDIETKINFVCQSKVDFKDLKEIEIDNYVSSKEPFDKAGSYAIQGIAGKFVKGIKGSFSNIIGLPLEQLYEVLLKENLIQY